MRRTCRRMEGGGAGAKELMLVKQGGIVSLGKVSEDDYRSWTVLELQMATMKFLSHDLISLHLNLMRDVERTQQTGNHTATEMKASRMAAATPAGAQ